MNKKRIAIFFRSKCGQLKELEITKKLEDFAYKVNMEIDCIQIEKQLFFDERKNKKYCKKNKRFELQIIWNKISQGEIDVLLINRLSDLGKSNQVKGIIEHLMFFNVDLISYEEIDYGLNTFGYSEKFQYKFILNSIKIINKYNRDIRSECIKSKLEQKRKKGEKLGRRSKINHQIIQEALLLRAEGKTFKEIGEKFNLHESTIRKKLDKIGNMF